MPGPPFTPVVTQQQAVQARRWLIALAVLLLVFVICAIPFAIGADDHVLVLSVTVLVLAFGIRDGWRSFRTIRLYKAYEPVAGQIVRHWHQSTTEVPMGYNDRSNGIFDARWCAARATDASSITCFLSIVPRSGGQPRTVIVPFDVYLFVVTYDIRDYDPADPMW